MNIFCYVVVGLDLLFNIFVVHKLKKENDKLHCQCYDLKKKIKELEKV